LGCKGGTIYRDSSRDEQILATDAKNLGKDAAEQLEKKKAEVKAEAAATEKELLQIDANNPHKIVVKQLIQNGTRYEVVPRERPNAMHGTTYKVNTPYGHLFVTINEDEHGPFEVFAQLGKAGGFFAAQSEAICRLISLGLRSGVAVSEIIKQIKGIRSTEVAFSEGEMIYSLPDAVGKVLEKHIQRNQQTLQLQFKEKQEAHEAKVEVAAEVKEIVSENKVTIQQKVSVANVGYAPVCPNCSAMLVMQEGCMKCADCGYSKCG